MQSYGDMGIPDGEGGMGMGDTKMIPDGKGGGKVIDAYKMNSILRRQQRAEEEEMNMTSGMNGGMSGEQYPQDDEEAEGLSPNEFQDQLAGEEGMGDDMGMEGGMEGDMEMGMDDESSDTGEMQQFFSDNPTPSDEEVAQYAQERGIDMQQMRQEVYALIQSLLDTQGGGEGDLFGDIEAAGDEEMDMGDEEMDMGDTEMDGMDDEATGEMGTDDMDGAKMSGSGGEMNSKYPSFDFSSDKEDEMEINFGNTEQVYGRRASDNIKRRK